MNTLILAVVLNAFFSASPNISEDQSIQERRNQRNARQKVLNQNIPCYNLQIWNDSARSSNGNIPVRIYRPSSDELLPALVFFHGGGFVFGNLDSSEVFCREIAHFAHCIVVSVDYPLAPEHPFPGAPEASYVAVNWVKRHLDDLGGKSLFVGGSSSGGTLAAVTAMMARDRNGPKINGQILLCPLTDSNFDTVSYHKYSTGYQLTREQCIWFLSQYAPNEASLKNPLLAPLQEVNFKDLPPAYVVAAELDPLRDDALGFVRKLKQAGVACKEQCYKGMIHGFPMHRLNLPEKKEVYEHIKLFIEAYSQK